MKKFTALILALVMCLTPCACGNQSAQTPDTVGTAGATAPRPSTASPEPAPAPTEDPEPTQETGPSTSQQHEWREASCTEPRTCILCGATEGAAKGHSWENATCLAPKTCSVCHATEGGLGDHHYREATCTEPMVCVDCGATSGSALGCTAGSDGKCIRCGKQMIDFSEVLSAPLDSMDSISRFVPRYYSQYCYYVGNFRFIFNSADGVILSWGATNTTDREIKYITFTIEYYNRVGDRTTDSITGRTYYTGRLTGPVGAGKSFYFRGLIGYGSDIYYGVITDVTIEYMDGTTISGYYGYTTWHNNRSEGSPNECFVTED